MPYRYAAAVDWKHGTVKGLPVVSDLITSADSLQPVVFVPVYMGGWYICHEQARVHPPQKIKDSMLWRLFLLLNKDFIFDFNGFILILSWF